MFKVKYLFWAGIISCFIGEVLTINILDVIVLFPVRVISILILPILLLYPTAKRNKGILRFASRLLILMVIYGTVSLIWSPDPSLGLRFVSMVFTGLIIFLLITRYAVDLSVLKKIMIIWSILSIISSLLGVYEIFNEQYLFSHVTDLGATNIESYRIWDIGWLTPRSFFPGPNEFAFFNAISALILMGWAFETRGVYRKLALIAISLAIILLIYSFSRAAIGGFIIGLMVFVFILSTKTKLVYRFSMIFLFIIMSISLIYQSQEIFDNNLAISLLKFKIENQDNSTRIFYASAAIYNGTIASFGFGRGLGASSEIILGGSYHSYLLEILAEFGLWIFLGYLTLLAKVCFQLMRAIKQRRNIFWSGGILASCIAFPALCSGPASLIAIYPYWLWLAFIVAFSELDSIKMRLNHSL
jgi:teichuronic acid biosynthesis protein TuaE